MENMIHLSHKSLMHLALALALLLMGSVNCFSLSIDDDDDDATPPITVELNFVASARKCTVPASKDDRRHHHAASSATSDDQKIGPAKHHDVELPTIAASPQIVVPL